MPVITKILGSSTFWVSIALPLLKILLGHLGIDIPWEIPVTGVAAYGAKEGLQQFGKKG